MLEDGYTHKGIFFFKYYFQIGKRPWFYDFNLSRKTIVRKNLKKKSENFIFWWVNLFLSLSHRFNTIWDLLISISGRISLLRRFNFNCVRWSSWKILEKGDSCCKALRDLYRWWRFRITLWPVHMVSVIRDRWLTHAATANVPRSPRLIARRDQVYRDNERILLPIITPYRWHYRARAIIVTKLW